MIVLLEREGKGREGKGGEVGRGRVGGVGGGGKRGEMRWDDEILRVNCEKNFRMIVGLGLIISFIIRF